VSDTTWSPEQPTDPGYYWFWTGVEGNFQNHAPCIVYVDAYGYFWEIGEGGRRSVDGAFPGYCQGPLPMPPRHLKEATGV
jgi:hypothetical protein